MNYAERKADRQKREAIIASWPDRLEAMKAATGMDIKTFCESCEPSVDDTYLSHIRAGRRGAGWDTINAVEQKLHDLGFPMPESENV